jgi:hypothetical protein
MTTRGGQRRRGLFPLPFRKRLSRGFAFRCRRPSSTGHLGCIGLGRRSPFGHCGVVNALPRSHASRIPSNMLSVCSCRSWELQLARPTSTLRRCASTKSTFQASLSASKQEALQLLFGGEFDPMALNFDMVGMDEV